MRRFGTALGGSLNFQRTVGSGSLNISQSKNRLLRFFENNFKIKESSVLVFTKTSTN
jgi:hypothetical protein